MFRLLEEMAGTVYGEHCNEHVLKSLVGELHDSLDHKYLLTYLLTVRMMKTKLMMLMMMMMWGGLKSPGFNFLFKKK